MTIGLIFKIAVDASLNSGNRVNIQNSCGRQSKQWQKRLIFKIASLLAQSGGDGRSTKKRTLDPEEGQRNEEILNHLPKNIVQVTATLP